ncbi:MAG: ABC transporter substrate-binding protein [Phycisphaeraceae bacterium]|nr:ABC transporter substrate-binding protein [Phycisphaeraceae bacterium]
MKLVLNWVPEPEFGGFYAAQQIGAYAKHGLDVEILPGGAGTPTLQMVGAGQAQFGIASADEVLTSRARGIDIVALFTVYQTCPQGVMTHEARGFKSLADVFAGEGKLAMEIGLPYGKFLTNKYGAGKIEVVPYAGGVAQFLADPNLSQQCFIFSEPLAARRQGAKTQVFLIADAGYNPYTAVVITRGDYLRQHPDQVKAMVAACREGWRAYLDDPGPANQIMGKLNTVMDAQTFADAAKAQMPLVENDFTRQHGLGAMTVERWSTLAEQLVSVGALDKAPAAAECLAAIKD